jgi:hypothetical protein
MMADDLTQGDWDALLEQGKWPDAFFNFDDSSDLVNDDDGRLTKAAESFVRLHPDCPYNVAWLVRDYERRI